MDLTTYSDTELQQLALDVRAEQNRRRQLEEAPEQVAELNRRVLRAKGLEEGEEWQQPTGAHDAYPEGWQVKTSDGKRWESTTGGNVWAPGNPGWREVSESSPSKTPEQ